MQTENATLPVQARMDCLLRTQTRLLACIDDIGNTCGPLAAQAFAVDAIKLFVIAERVTREAA